MEDDYQQEPQDIYGRGLLLKERKFTSQTSHRGYHVEFSRPNDAMAWKLLYFVTLLIVVYYFNGMLLLNIRASKLTVCSSIAVLIIVVAFFFCTSQNESLIVMEQIGLQITLRTNYLWTTSKTQFFPLAAIKDVIINETFYRHKVIYYLTILVKEGPIEQNEDDNFNNIKLVPLFTESLPRYKSLIKIYHNIKETLTPPQDKKEK